MKEILLAILCVICIKSCQIINIAYPEVQWFDWPWDKIAYDNEKALRR